jgi:hypothetical protein
MDGTNAQRVLRSLGSMVTSPRHALLWLSDRVTAKSALDRRLPWIAWSAIRYLTDNIRPGAHVFEWGAGGSTAFFLDRGCIVTSIESSGLWTSRVLQSLSVEQRLQLDLQLIPAAAEDDSSTQRYVEAILQNDRLWDVVLVDGLEEAYVSRTSCVRNAASRVKSGGILVLDDAWRPEYSQINSILSGWAHLIFRSLGPARLGVTQTDIYARP